MKGSVCFIGRDVEGRGDGNPSDFDDDSHHFLVYFYILFFGIKKISESVKKWYEKKTGTFLSP